ncbi:lipocalin family protein [Chryseobacterium oryctis]|uniref:Lipocalin family protein n=1 Tax=Chryseobacterium oryctis TaxID=2952618 RepID=A0ABT3HST3_9FLAO|nr:lipocalin family protein [Chryseobacterium oryctis]MCW3162837.1 lipocalin family protein [Chryseobacterium oryctis]
MKKILFLAVAAASTLALGSCSNDDNEDETTIVGTWKHSQVRVISGKDNSTILSNNILDDCEKKQTSEFTADGKLKSNYYEFYNGSCNHYYDETSYTYNKTTKVLVVDGVTTPVKSLTKAEFVVIDSSMDGEDYNNDGYDDIYELHLVK